MKKEKLIGQLSMKTSTYDFEKTVSKIHALSKKKAKIENKLGYIKKNKNLKNKPKNLQNNLTTVIKENIYCFFEVLLACIVLWFLLKFVFKVTFMEFLFVNLFIL